MRTARSTTMPRTKTCRAGTNAGVAKRHVNAPSLERAREPAPVAALDQDRTSVDGRLDAEDMARLLTGFRGQPISITPGMRYVRASGDGQAPAYLFDEESGMVYILD